MREMVPGANLVALLVNPDNPSAGTHAEEVRVAAQALGRRLVVLQSRSAPDFAAAFETLRNERAGALVVQGDPFFDSERNALIALARRHGVPAIYHIREFPLAGGLVSYGPSLVDSLRAARRHRRPCAQGRAPSRPSGHAPDKVRARDQYENGECAPRRGSSPSAAARRRGDRVTHRRADTSATCFQPISSRVSPSQRTAPPALLDADVTPAPRPHSVG